MNQHNFYLKSRRSIRLSHYDYSQNGAYFVTLCTGGKKHIFGNICNDRIEWSHTGRIAVQCWTRIPDHFTDAELDVFSIMPNHIHGIIIIDNDAGNELVGARHAVPLQEKRKFGPLQPNSLHVIIGSYKSACSRIIHQLGHRDFHWQRNYHEHVIRDDSELNDIRQYILENPHRWQFDMDNERRIIDDREQKFWRKYMQGHDSSCPHQPCSGSTSMRVR
jgi:REP element-mobilizing transposase RayT